MCINSLCVHQASLSLSVGYPITSLSLHHSISSSSIFPKRSVHPLFFPPTNSKSTYISPPHPFKILFYNKATAPIPIANKPAAIFGACVSYAAPSEVALLAAPPRREVALPTIPPTPPEVAELSALLALEDALLSALLALLSALLTLDEREELFEEKRKVSYSVMDGKKRGEGYILRSIASRLASSRHGRFGT